MGEAHEFDQQIREAFGTQFALERELPGGGMSRVYLATERALNRKVVIKVLPPELAAGVNRERFRREIQLAAQLQHPHIVPLYAAGAHGDLLYYTMPFIEGESLKHALHGERPQRFTPRDVMRILQDVVDALAYAHGRGVIHRDIKPGNVLRSGTHAVVTDFGVAKAISAAMPAVGMTASGMVIGTPAYMAPEQLAGDPAADQRVDIYAVGLLAYELLTGTAPFERASPAETMAAQLTQAPPPIELVRADVPPRLRALIMRCLAKDPGERPRHATELLDQLADIAVPAGAGASAVAPTRRTVIALTTVVAVVMTLLVVQRGRNRAAITAAPDSARTIAESAAVTALTRADSLAITAAIEAKFSERASAMMTPKPRTIPDAAVMAALADSLRAEIQKAVLDSLRGTSRAAVATAFTDRSVRSMQQLTPAHWEARAAALGPARRVVVADPAPDPRNPALADSGAVIMSRMRRALSRARGRFAVVPADSTRAVLAGTRNPRTVAEALHADMIVSVRPKVMSGDSLLWTMTLRDLTATSGFAERTTTMTLPMTTTGVRLDSLIRVSMRWLDQMDRSPRRTDVTNPK